MSFLVKGSLKGLLCEDCTENLTGVSVFLYTTDPNSNIGANVSASVDETFQPISVEQHRSKENRLIGTAVVDKAGCFLIEIKGAHAEWPLEIDIAINEVPNGSKKVDEPFYFHVTTTVPRWVSASDNQDILVYNFEYTISSKWWCLIRGQYFDSWVICGRLVDCETKFPLAGFEVIAMDDDLLKDDELGSAITDSNGHFTIYYSSRDFKKTFLSPIINIETDAFPLRFTKGPDVFFRLKKDGTEFEFEGPRDCRRNVDYCLCVELCLDNATIVPPPIPDMYTHFGDYDRIEIKDDISATTGQITKAGREQYAFFGSVFQIGTYHKANEANELYEYKFQTQVVSGPGVSPVSTAWVDVEKNMMGRAEIGVRWFPTGDRENPYISKGVVINPNSDDTADPLVLEVNVVDGWIQMPGDHNFAPNVNGILAQIRTTDAKIAPTKLVDMSAMTHGQETLSFAPAVDDTYVVFRMIRRVQGTTDVSVFDMLGQSEAVAIHNVIFQNVKIQGSWSPDTDDRTAVCCFDIQELSAGGCGNISNSVTLLFNARHKYMERAFFWIHGPGATTGPTAISMPTVPLSNPDSFGALPVPGIEGLRDCAFTIMMDASLKLTNGNHRLNVPYDIVSFCKVSS